LKNPPPPDNQPAVAMATPAPSANPEPSMATPQLVSQQQNESAAPKGDPVDAGTLEALLAPVLSPHTQAAIVDAAPGLRAALILGSPDFMRR